MSGKLILKKEDDTELCPCLSCLFKMYVFTNVGSDLVTLYELVKSVTHYVNLTKTLGLEFRELFCIFKF